MPAAEALAPDKPHSAEHGLVDEEMVQRLAHAGCQFKADKAIGFSHLVTATLGTIYATTLSPFKRSKDSCSAMVTTKVQFAVPAHWDEEAKKDERHDDEQKIHRTRKSKHFICLRVNTESLSTRFSVALITLLWRYQMNALVLGTYLIT